MTRRIVNPHKKFEIEIAPVCVWFTPLDVFGKPYEHGAMYVDFSDLENDIIWLTARLQSWFDF